MQTAVDQIKQVTQLTGENSQQPVRAASQLQTEAEEMLTLVTRFDLG